MARRQYAQYAVYGVSAVLCASAIAIVVLVHAYTVQGISMEPTLTAGERIIVVGVTHSLFLYRGQVIVYRDPRTSEHQYEVKRIIGLPGETVSIDHDVVSLRAQTGEVTVLEAGSALGRRDNGKDMSMYLGPDDYFVMGDNRPGSRDSRHFGTIQPSEMVGVVVWPL